jgi:hypothetical protein
VSEPSGGLPPYRVVYSGLCRDQARQLLARAAAKGRFAEVAQAVRGIDTRLQWIRLDFGEPLRDFFQMGIKEHIGVHAPLVVKYAVDEARHTVYVSLPFGLLPKSGL